jgi:adenosylcobinamide amidohydrolase
MIKHVGKHNNKKIVILFRKVPGEEHMALVAYSDTLPARIHDDLMIAVESESGQQSKELSDYLFRAIGTDGNSILSTLHREGFIKKVPTNQVIVTPNRNSSVRLDELNEILNKMELGEQAVKEMADLDKNAGMTGKRRQSRDVGEVGVSPASRTQQQVNVNTNISLNEVLSDEQLSAQRMAQAQKMAAEAKALLAEAKRLEAEAKALNPVKKTNGKTTKTKTAKTKEA